MTNKISPEVDAQVKDLLNKMSLDQKVRIMHGEPSFTKGIKGLMEDDDYHKKPCMAGVIPELGIQGIRFIDGPRGVVLEGGATSFPVPMGRGASFDTAIERQIGQAIGREHRVLGGNLFGGVCINLLRHPAWGRAQETYGEEPMLLGDMGAALAEGVQENVMACVKHFAVNSIENARFQVDVKASERALHEVYLPHFKRVVDAGVASVMSSYNALNGEWCGQNKTLLRSILKDKWGFKGYVITDFVFGMRDAKLAALAGQDIEMPFQMHYARFLSRLVSKGEVPMSVIDDAVGRVLRQQLSYQELPVPAKEMLACPEHIALARESARSSLVLLKNETPNNTPVLPLSKGAKIAVIGELANQANLGDHGSSDGRPDYVVTPLAGIQNAVDDKSNITFNDAADVEQAVAAAKSADTAVVVVGYTYLDEGEYIAPISMEPFADGIAPPKLLEPLFRLKPFAELWRKLISKASQKRNEEMIQREDTVFGVGGDRSSLRLSDKHEALIKAVSQANPNTVVLVMAGSAVMMNDWQDDVSSIMLVWYPGMEGGNAIADVLFGDYSPAGRLPFSIPKSESHLPDFDRDAKEIEYGLWHGYKKLALDGNQAMFPFGYGLSYSEFAVSDFSADANRESYKADVTESADVSFTVSNSGKVDSDYVWQLYVLPPESEIERAPRNIASFGRVHVKAGEKLTLQANVAFQALAIYDEHARDFVVPAGNYRLALLENAEAPEQHSVTLMVG